MIQYFRNGNKFNYAVDQNGNQYIIGVDDNGYKSYMPRTQKDGELKYLSDTDGTGLKWHNTNYINKTLDPVVATGHQSEEAKQKIQQKQIFLKSAGYDVPVDGKWNTDLQKMYDEATTKQKEYPTTPSGLMQSMWDKFRGDTTYKIDPAKPQAQFETDNRSKFGRWFDQQSNDNHTPIGYATQTILPAAITASSIVNPTITLRTTVGPALLSMGATKGVDEVSKVTTGKTWEQNLQPLLGNNLGVASNPGYLLGAKWAQHAKNFGRYVMDNVTPAAYGGHSLQFVTAFAKALNPFSKVPTFYNGRRPKWYREGTITGDQDVRFENMANWVGIPEKEVPRTLTYKRADGTYGFNQNAVRKFPYIADDEGETPNIKVGKKAIVQDGVFGVGGEHSDFTLKGDKPQGRLWLYEDEQKLNPQWQVADKLKNFFNVGGDENKDRKLTKFIDWFGGKDLKGMIGFDKDLKLKQYLYEDKKTGNIYTIPDQEIGPEYR